ncbi:unnamed protein product [Meloidogyne enterolobii]|uniref:Uncharacterized protein n=1 Tax=Meloidogyne enterolobii TaxID=390850 RepID=A0ACB1AMX9_MELEN
MNIFRLSADLAHLVAILILLWKIWKTRSCLSGRSQVLFLLVFVCRYLDIFTNFVSIYNTVMKLFFISSSVATVYFIYQKFRATFDRNHDTCRIEFLVLPSFALALLINHDFSFFEVLWTFSIYLESVAIMPQLFMLSKTGSAETITAHYLFALEDFLDIIALVAGIVQTVLYADFFYLYVSKVVQQKYVYLILTSLARVFTQPGPHMIFFRGGEAKGGNIFLRPLPPWLRT